MFEAVPNTHKAAFAHTSEKIQSLLSCNEHSSMYSESESLRQVGNTICAGAVPYNLF